jgi:hypothetical protein
MGEIKAPSQRLDSEGLQWEQTGIVRLTARFVRRCVYRVTHQAGGVSIGFGSGQRSPGASSEEAAVRDGLSSAVGNRWFRESGGMPTVSRTPLSGRYLSFGEREEIAILHAQNYGMRAIARRPGRAPSTISRELRRNAATRSGALAYRAAPRTSGPATGSAGSDPY